MAISVDSDGVSVCFELFSVNILCISPADYDLWFERSPPFAPRGVRRRIALSWSAWNSIFHGPSLKFAFGPAVGCKITFKSV